MPNSNGANGSGPQVTSGVEWRALREQGVLIQLPSGFYARLRPVSIEQMIAGGEIPDLLTPLVTKMFLDGADSVDLETFLVQKGPDKALAEIGQMTRLMDAICVAAFVQPRIVDNPQADDEISIDDLDITDKSAVFHRVQQPTAVLRRFRLEQTADVEAVSDGENAGAEAEPVVGGE